MFSSMMLPLELADMVMELLSYPDFLALRETCCVWSRRCFPGRYLHLPNVSALCHPSDANSVSALVLDTCALDQVSSAMTIFPKLLKFVCNFTPGTQVLFVHLECPPSLKTLTLRGEFDTKSHLDPTRVHVTGLALGALKLMGLDLSGVDVARCPVLKHVHVSHSARLVSVDHVDHLESVKFFETPLLRACYLNPETLTTITLHNCAHWKQGPVTRLSQLHKLSNLSLKNTSYPYLSDDVHSLPYLQNLTVVTVFEQLRLAFRSSCVQKVVVSQAASLSFLHCHRLTSLTAQFGSVGDLRLQNCPKFSTLSIDRVNRLRVTNCPKFDYPGFSQSEGRTWTLTSYRLRPFFLTLDRTVY